MTSTCSIEDSSSVGEREEGDCVAGADRSGNPVTGCPQSIIPSARSPDPDYHEVRCGSLNRLLTIASVSRTLVLSVPEGFHRARQLSCAASRTPPIGTRPRAGLHVRKHRFRNMHTNERVVRVEAGGDQRVDDGVGPPAVRQSDRRHLVRCPAGADSAESTSTTVLQESEVSVSTRSGSNVTTRVSAGSAIAVVGTCAARPGPGAAAGSVQLAFCHCDSVREPTEPLDGNRPRGRAPIYPCGWT